MKKKHKYWDGTKEGADWFSYDNFCYQLGNLMTWLFILGIITKIFS